MRPLRLATILVLASLAGLAFGQDDFGPEPIPGDTTSTADEDALSLTPSTSTSSSEGAPAALDPTKVRYVDRDDSRLLELRSAIEEALRRNPFEMVRTNENARIDLLKSDLFEGFWLPNVSLDMNVSNQRYDRLYSSSQSAAGAGAPTSPTGSVGIAIKDYTIFNWGRDYLQYLNDKQNLNRSQQRLTEARRLLRFNVIDQYFNLVRVKEFMRIKREQLRQSSFIHRLSRERLQMKTIPALQYYQTRGEYLRSQTEYQQSLFDIGQEEQKMADLLGDEYRPAYRTQEQLKYSPITTTPEEGITTAFDRSPVYRDAKVAYETATRTYEKTIKDNLPLPKFSVGMGTYQQQFNGGGNSWLRQTDADHNVQMVAAVNMSWTLIGEGGLFNSRVNKQAYLDKRITEIKFYNAKRAIEVQIRTLMRTIKFLEQKVVIAEYQQKNARSSYDSAVSNFSAARTGFPQVKLALDNWIISDMNTLTVKYEHLQKKLELAQVMGVDDLPGENFETLAVR